jgi:hypothetical protein
MRVTSRKAFQLKGLSVSNRPVIRSNCRKTYLGRVDYRRGRTRRSVFLCKTTCSLPAFSSLMARYGINQVPLTPKTQTEIVSLGRTIAIDPGRL